MEFDQIKKACEIYKAHLVGLGRQSIKYSEDNFSSMTGLDKQQHMLWMCEEILSEKILGEKAHRWLGFIQGCLWVNDQFSIDQMKDHNR